MPDTQGEGEPHHDDPRPPQRRAAFVATAGADVAERRNNRRAERDHDQDARAAIPARAALALSGLARPDADFEQRPRREGQVSKRRHGRRPGMARRGARHGRRPVLLPPAGRGIVRRRGCDGASALQGRRGYGSGSASAPRCRDSCSRAASGRSIRCAETTPLPRSRSLTLRACSSSQAGASNSRPRRLLSTRKQTRAGIPAFAFTARPRSKCGPAARGRKWAI